MSAAGIRHCLIDGDDLDMAHPPPWENEAERNLATMWSNYREWGNRRLINVNTARREGSERRSVGGRQDVRRQQHRVRLGEGGQSGRLAVGVLNGDA